MFPFFAFIMFDLYHVYIPMYIYIYFFLAGLEVTRLELEFHDLVPPFSPPDGLLVSVSG